MLLGERERERERIFFLPYLWPKTQVSEIKGKALLEKREKSRVWRRMGVRSSNKLFF